MRDDADVTVVARWDDMAALWVATSKDVPGLATVAPSIQELKERLAVSVPEFLELNRPDFYKDSEIPIFLLMRGQSDVVARVA